MRPISEVCEICSTFSPTHGIGFPAWPGAIPGLPNHLRGGCIWVCADPACDLAAQKRAIAAAARAEVTLTKICRVYRFNQP